MLASDVHIMLCQHVYGADTYLYYNLPWNEHPYPITHVIVTGTGEPRRIANVSAMNNSILNLFVIRSYQVVIPTIDSPVFV